MRQTNDSQLIHREWNISNSPTNHVFTLFLNNKNTFHSLTILRNDYNFFKIFCSHFFFNMLIQPYEHDKEKTILWGRNHKIDWTFKSMNKEKPFVLVEFRAPRIQFCQRRTPQNYSMTVGVLLSSTTNQPTFQFTILRYSTVSKQAVWWKPVNEWNFEHMRFYVQEQEKKNLGRAKNHVGFWMNVSSSLLLFVSQGNLFW